MKIVYTDSGREALAAFKEAKARELEAEIKSRKYVYGDETIEITASDVREVADRVRASSRLGRRHSNAQLVLQVYVIVGFLTVVAGLCYPNLRAMIAKDPIQLLLIGFGAFVAVISFLALQRIRSRDQERRRLELVEEEARRVEEDIIRNRRTLMAYVEPEPKGAPEGSPITHYVLEYAHGARVTNTNYATQRDAVRDAKDLGHRPLVARVRTTDKGNPDHWRSA